jgi:tetratricopeptide (TPR) repeat protein
MKTLICTFLSLLTISLFAQPGPMSYIDQHEKTHLLGTFDRSVLQQDPFLEWFDQYYASYIPSSTIIQKIRTFNSEDIKIKIYLGTWCGDSKREVSRFLKLVDESNIENEQVELTGLDNRPEYYKQGPNREEKGLNIHRVPTFIFYRNNAEIGRIVEYPSSSLETDVAQILSGMPPNSNYPMSNRIGQMLAEMPVDEVESTLLDKAKGIRSKIKSESELNSLGYVLIGADEIEKALVVFKLNSILFPESGNVFDSLAEVYLKAGDMELAIENYMRSYQIDPTNENALVMVKSMLITP